MLYRFVEVEFDRDTAGRTALYLAVFPTALFFFAAYNESLFLFFLLLSFYAMRHRSWWLAGLFGGLATLTRSIGMALLVIFLFLFIILLALCFVGPERFAVSQWSMPLFGIMAISLLLIFPGTANNPLPSMERYVLEIFPAFIMLARFGRRPCFHQSYLLLSLPMLAFLTLQFLTGHWTI